MSSARLAAQLRNLKAEIDSPKALLSALESPTPKARVQALRDEEARQRAELDAQASVDAGCDREAHAPLHVTSLYTRRTTCMTLRTKLSTLKETCHTEQPVISKTSYIRSSRPLAADSASSAVSKHSSSE